MNTKNWIEDVSVGKCGNGWFVRIDGCDVFDIVNEFGCKGRRTFSIAEGLGSREEAKEKAIEWVTKQIEKLNA